MEAKVLFYGVPHECSLTQPVKTYARVAADRLDQKAAAKLLGIAKGTILFVRQAETRWAGEKDHKVFEVAIVPACVGKELPRSTRDETVKGYFEMVIDGARWEIEEAKHPTLVLKTPGQELPSIIAIVEGRVFFVLAGGLLEKYFLPVVRRLIPEVQESRFGNEILATSLPANQVLLRFDYELRRQFLIFLDAQANPVLMIHRQEKVCHVHCYRPEFADAVQAATEERHAAEKEEAGIVSFIFSLVGDAKRDRSKWN